MSTFYLDLEGGNDSNDGTTYANRWLTFTSGATAARIAPGDTIRIMASPDPTLIGTCSWAQNSKTITLPGAVTANICDCETAWSALTDVTATADTTTYKEGTKSAKLVIASAFITGKLAYFQTTSNLNLSGYQQVSFWIYNTVAIAASTLSLKLCTDTIGSSAAHTFVIPAIPSTSSWVCLTFNTGANLNSAINSVALYQDSDIAATTIQLDNIIACKAASSADSLSLTSLIGKVHNLSWVASTTYAQNDKIRPTQANRNGYQFMKQNSGSQSSGGSEPTWPSVLGATVTDGSVTWVCQELEDTWYAIQSINGTTVKLDNGPGTLGNAGRGYSGATESVATYKREVIKGTMGTASASDVHSVQDSGSIAGYITFAGGYDRTNMSTLSGETWFSGQNGQGRFNGLAASYIKFSNFNLTKMGNGFANFGGPWEFLNTHCNNAGTSGIVNAAAPINGGVKITGGCFCNNNTTNLSISSAQLIAVTLNGSVAAASGLSSCTGKDIVALNNGTYLSSSASVNGGNTFSNLTTGSNGNGCLNITAIGGGPWTLINSLINDSTEFVATNNNYIYSQKHDQTADNHYIATDGGSIISATDQRHTASGISWKFRPTSTTRFIDYPLVLSIEALAVKANAQVTIQVWTRRDSTNIKGRLVIKGGQLNGVGNDVVVACEPTINTWVLSDPLTFTPTEAGVIEVQFWVHDGVGTTNSYHIDDFSASQA